MSTFNRNTVENFIILKFNILHNKMSDTSSLHKRLYAVLKTFLNGATEQKLTSEFNYFAGYDIPFENYAMMKVLCCTLRSLMDNIHQWKISIDISKFYNIFLIIYLFLIFICDYVPPKRNANAASSSSERAITETETNPIEEIEQPEEQQSFF
ncbi:hypothetical protein T07_3415 [Trichinella nelsoni]|uniref:Uncharacterized protein n=1 Tax=Trichinella nelsoni TaxID=6336 RepID=A0A0V0SKP4_9BILA|nr:hypothetical protein T07_3415 [Trichinella nelsoni]